MNRAFGLVLLAGGLLLGSPNTSAGADNLTSANVVKMLKTMKENDCCHMIWSPKASVRDTQVTISSSSPWRNKLEAQGQLANTIYHTFKSFPKAQKVTAKFVESVESAYGEPDGYRNVLVLEATRSQYNRLRKNGFWKNGPSVAVWSNAPLEGIVDLLKVE